MRKTDSGSTKDFGAAKRSSLGVKQKNTTSSIRLVVLFGVLSALSLVFFYFFVDVFFESSRRADFLLETDSLNDLIVDRLEIYTSTLRGGKGLFDASENVTRNEWHRYAESLRLSKHYPGIQGIGYAEWLLPSEVAEHVQRVRDEGHPSYDIRPVGEREVYTTIVFLEPFDTRNQQAFGFDMYQEETRNLAMSRAVETGEPALSGKVTLVQEIDQDVQAGFLIYLPVYRRDADVYTVEEKEAAIEGFVYSPYRMNNFIEGIAQKHTSIHFEIYDGGDTDNLTEDRLMYKSPSGVKDSYFSKTKMIYYGGHVWTVRYTASEKYGLSILRSTGLPLAIFVGIIFLFFFFWLLFVHRSRERVAFQIAEGMVGDLQKKEKENERIRKEMERINKTLSDQTKEMNQKIEELEKVNDHFADREIKMIELKEKIRKLKGEKT